LPALRDPGKINGYSSTTSLMAKEKGAVKVNVNEMM